MTDIYTYRTNQTVKVNRRDPIEGELSSSSSKWTRRRNEGAPPARHARCDRRRGCFDAKLLLLILLILFDVAINGSAEYDDFSRDEDDGVDNGGSAKNLHMLLLGLQLLSQLLIFSLLFSLISGTFPFRVGLIGILARRFRLVLMMHPAYILISCVVGGMRLVGSVYLFPPLAKRISLFLSLSPREQKTPLPPHFLNPSSSPTTMTRSICLLSYHTP